MGIEQLRKEYLTIRNLFVGETRITSKEFDELVGKSIPEDSVDLKASLYVKYAKLFTAKCARCGGTGQFITGMLNGKLVGPGGVCFRCEGKGIQNYADVVRNENYELYGRKYY